MNPNQLPDALAELRWYREEAEEGFAPTAVEFPPPPPTAYEVLNLPADATQEEIRKRHRRLALKHHSDKARVHTSSPDPHADEAMMRINQWHDFVRTPEIRAAYDRWLGAFDAWSTSGIVPASSSPRGFSGWEWDPRSWVSRWMKKAAGEFGGGSIIAPRHLPALKNLRDALLLIPSILRWTFILSVFVLVVADSLLELTSLPSGPTTPQQRTQTHYETLNISRAASTPEVRAAYRRLARLCHPDKINCRIKGKARAKPKAEDTSESEAFIALTTAYSVLSDPYTRCVYDWQHQKREEPPSLRFREGSLYPHVLCWHIGLPRTLRGALSSSFFSSRAAGDANPNDDANADAYSDSSLGEGCGEEGALIVTYVYAPARAALHRALAVIHRRTCYGSVIILRLYAFLVWSLGLGRPDFCV